MLCLSMQPGEYLKIGDQVFVQYEDTKSGRCRLSVFAPREVAILRGAVYEEQGGKRPDCLKAPPRAEHKARCELPWGRSKAQALKAMRVTLEHMEASPEVEALRRQLAHMFPETDKRSV